MIARGIVNSIYVKIYKNGIEFHYSIFMQKWSRHIPSRTKLEMAATEGEGSGV
jgi:hypothetical protein